MEQKQESAPPSAPSLPTIPRPSGPLLKLEKAPERIWIAPERLRSPAGIDGWIEGVREFAAIDAILVRLAADVTIQSGGKIHVEIPGPTPRYLPYRFDSSEKFPEGKAIKLPAGSTLLLHQTAGIARFFQLKQEPADEKTGNYQEMLAARVSAVLVTDPAPPPGGSGGAPGTAP